MNADMRQRLIDFARGEIAAQVQQLRLRGGQGMTEQDGMLGLRPRPAVRAVEEDEATWELVVFVRITWTDTLNGNGVSALTPARVPRVLGILEGISLWESQGDMVEDLTTPWTRTLSIEFYTRRFPRPPTGTPVFEDGLEYPGTVRFTLREVFLPAVTDTGVSYEVTIPPEGVVQAFSASVTNQLLGLSPVLDSIVRVRD